MHSFDMMLNRVEMQEPMIRDSPVAETPGTSGSRKERKITREELAALEAAEAAVAKALAAQKAQNPDGNLPSNQAQKQDIKGAVLPPSAFTAALGARGPEVDMIDQILSGKPANIIPPAPTKASSVAKTSPANAKSDSDASQSTAKNVVSARSEESKAVAVPPVAAAATTAPVIPPRPSPTPSRPAAPVKPKAAPQPQAPPHVLSSDDMQTVSEAVALLVKHRYESVSESK